MKFAVLPGDGIGPEITEAQVRVLEAAKRKFGLQIELEHHPVGFSALKSVGTTLPPAAMEACRTADGILLGPVSHLDYPQGCPNPSGGLRIALDLYANMRPSRTREGLPHWGRTAMDLVIARENTEGFYADRSMHMGIGEFMPTPDLALSVRKISAHGSRRIALAAFRLARTRRKKVTAVHKINVLKVTEGLWLREVRAVAKEFPDVACDEQLIDSMTAMLVRDAARFDVVVTTNMYGDILSDLAAELSGGLGLAGSINAGDEHCMAQAQHGSAPDIAGKDVANPTSSILSLVMLLEWLSERRKNDALLKAARAISASLEAALKSPSSRTRDLGGTLGTKAFTSQVVERLG